jgi:riboflavin kinase/FMN adenylyltransferase
LGFPTANIDPGPLLLPPQGVYACLAKLGEAFFPAAANLGLNPSFDGKTPSLEAHILDFEGELHDLELRLYFLEFLRSEQRFSDLDDLKTQIRLDVEATRRIARNAQTERNFSDLFPL